MHEVGHALGLRHNFRGSTGIKFEQLRDAAFTRQRGISNSVMDYNALNVPLENEAVTDFNQATLGNYDHWAIEYAYRELAPENEAAELARIAARSATDPSLAYATDEDVMRVFVPDERGALALFEVAAREGVQVRHLRPSLPTLEDVFAQAVGEE